MTLDIEKLKELEKESTQSPWYAWLDPKVNIEDKCITTLPYDQYVKEYDEAMQHDHEYSDAMEKDPTLPYKFFYRSLTTDEEVIGCSEWMRGKDKDFVFIAEMRNQLPELLDYIDRLEKAYLNLYILEQSYESYSSVDRSEVWKKEAQESLEKIKNEV